MSSLTSETKVIYLPVLYDYAEEIIDEGSEWFTETEACVEGKQMVAEYIEQHNEYCYVIVECRVEPVYK